MANTATVENKEAEGLKQVVQLRDSIEKLGPYQSLALLAVPVCLVEPLKLIAVFVVGEGHWITGTVMITVAYAVSLLVIERLFMVVKPKLLRLRWFARIWSWFIVKRYKFATPFRDKAHSSPSLGYRSSGAVRKRVTNG